MKRVLFVTMHRLKRSPGQRFRFEQYIPYLEQHGYHCDVSYLISTDDDRIVYAPGHYFGKFLILMKSIWTRLFDVISANKYEIIFIHREALMVNSALFERLFSSSRAKLVFDFDDAIWMQRVSKGNAGLRWLRSGPSKLPAILRRMDLVMAGNAYLAAYAKAYNQNVQIIPTTLDTDRYAPRPRPAGDAICVGWSGSHSTVPYFAELVPALGRLQSAFGDRIRFRLIADRTYAFPGLEVESLKWREDTELEDTAAFDIGVMPLPDDPWTRGKCAFKALLYMSLAIPAVASPVGVNTDVIRDGVNGLLAASEDEWVRRIGELIADPDRRRAIGHAGRETVVREYSLKSQRDRYLGLFEDLTAQSPARRGERLVAVQ